MNRRRWLCASPAALVGVALAGCGFDDGDYRDADAPRFVPAPAGVSLSAESLTIPA